MTSPTNKLAIESEHMSEMSKLIITIYKEHDRMVANYDWRQGPFGLKIHVPSNMQNIRGWAIWSFALVQLDPGHQDHLSR